MALSFMHNCYKIQMEKLDAEILIVQVSYKQCANIYNYVRV